MNTSFKIHNSALKTVIRLIIVVAPLTIQLLPAEWANLTLSGVLMVGMDWLKHEYSVL